MALEGKTVSLPTPVLDTKVLVTGTTVEFHLCPKVQLALTGTAVAFPSPCPPSSIATVKDWLVGEDPDNNGDGDEVV